jgi:hypothetical protein
LAALLAIATPFGVPVSSVAAPSYGIVRIDAARRAEQRIAERRERTLLPQPRTSPVMPSDDLRGPILILDQSLFQRPPPAALLFRV